MRILERRVEGGAGEVEAGAGDLRLQPGEQPERLGVALEAAAGQRAARVSEGRQRRLPVVPERRVAQVVRQARRVHQVGVAAERGAEFPADLRALQRMGQPGAREIAGPDLYYLRFRGEPAQCGAVQDTRAITLKIRTARALGRLGRPALGVR
jgi:hypothetical protein